MTNHKYLTDLGVDPHDITSNFCEPDNREQQWADERSIYGFDERETWALDASFYQWLYERLMMYKKVNYVDLAFHKFEYNGEEKTQEELIDLMLEYLKIILLDPWSSLDDESSSKVMEIGKIWAIVLPAMWW